MLSAAEIADAIPDVIARNVDMAARLGIGHRRHKRLLGQKYETVAEGDHAIKPGDFRATEMLVATEDEASQLCADTADLLEAVRTFFADQNERRPAPVLHLVMSASKAAPRPAGPSLLARMAAAIIGHDESAPPARHCRTLKAAAEAGLATEKHDHV